MVAVFVYSLFGRLLVVSVNVGCLYSCYAICLFSCGGWVCSLCSFESYFVGSCQSSIVCHAY